MKIDKVKICNCIDLKTKKEMFQLQFREVGKRNYKGFSADFFSTEQAAKEALDKHNKGYRVYNAFASNGSFFICKALTDKSAVNSPHYDGAMRLEKLTE